MFAGYRLIKRRVGDIELLDLRRVLYADLSDSSIIGVESRPYFLEGADRRAILDQIESMVDAIEQPYLRIPHLDE